jgi:hypothetical protein
MVNEVCSKFAECHVCAAMGPECMPSNLSDDEATKLWNNRASNITSELADGTTVVQGSGAYYYDCRNCIHGGKAAGCKQCFECCKKIHDHFKPKK